MKSLVSRGALSISASLLILAMPLFAHALTVPPPASGFTIPRPAVNNTDDVANLFCGALTWIFWILIIFSIVMFLVGGYRYVTSGGEAERVRSANKTLLYAAIAVVVALVASGMPSLVSSFIGGGFSGSVCQSGAFFF